jgi:hypothetical protein
MLRDPLFLEQETRHETDQNGQTQARIPVATAPQRCDRRLLPFRSLLLEPMAHRHGANGDAMRAKLLLKVCAEVRHQSAAIDVSAGRRLGNQLDVLTSDWIRDTMRLGSEHAWIQQRDSLDFTGQNLQSANVDYFLRPADNLDISIVLFDDVAGVVPPVNKWRWRVHVTEHPVRRSNVEDVVYNPRFDSLPSDLHPQTVARA